LGTHFSPGSAWQGLLIDNFIGLKLVAQAELGLEFPFPSSSLGTRKEN
jgi:hypothetical protein